MKASIVICGAGIVGMATALGLARQGIKDIVLVGPLPKLAPMQRNV